METILSYNMIISWISFWVCFIGNCQGDIILSVISSKSNRPLECILDGEVSAVVSCEIKPNTSTSVIWKKNTASLSTCDNTADNCLPAVNGKYSFTSNFTQSQFYLNISSVALGSDEGVYYCEEGGLEENITLVVCKVPTTVTFTVSGHGTVTLTSSSGCVYPDTDVTIEWFYVHVSSPNTEERYSVTPTNDSKISDCQNGAKKVTSTIQHTDATENMIEVYFRVKVHHPALAEPVEATFNSASYFITDKNTKHSGNEGLIIAGATGWIGLVLLVILLCYLRQRNSNVLRIISLYEGDGYILTWNPPRPSETTGLIYYIVYWRQNSWKCYRKVNSNTTYSEIDSSALEYDLKVCAEYEKLIKSETNLKGDELSWDYKHSPGKHLGYVVKQEISQDHWKVFYNAEPNELKCKIYPPKKKWEVYVKFEKTVAKKKRVRGSFISPKESNRVADRGKRDVCIIPLDAENHYILTWKSPPTTLRVSKYHILGRQNKKEKWKPIAEAQATQTSCILASEDVQWQVRAEESYGAVSDVGEAEVNADVPSNPKGIVSNINYRDHGEKTEICLTWEKPDNSGKSPIQYYQIWMARHLNYHETHRYWKRSHVVPQNKITLSDDNWEEGMNVRIGICAVNKQGHGQMGFEGNQQYIGLPERERDSASASASTAASASASASASTAATASDVVFQT